MQIVQTPPSRGVQITKDHLYRLYRSHPGDKYLDDANPVNFGATLSFKHYSSPCLLPGMRHDMREHRRLDHYSSLLAIPGRSVAHDSVFSEIIFTQNRGARVLPASPIFNLRNPPAFMPPTSRRGTLYTVRDRISTTNTKTHKHTSRRTQHMSRRVADVAEAVTVFRWRIFLPLQVSPTGDKLLYTIYLVCHTYAAGRELWYIRVVRVFRHI